MVMITKDIEEKALKFLKDNTKTVDDSYYYNGKRREWIHDIFRCPCCDYASLNSLSRADIETIRTDFTGYLIHLNSQIRLHASKGHIKIFEELFGIERTNEFLRFAIAKNKAVTQELERIYNNRISQEVLI